MKRKAIDIPDTATQRIQEHAEDFVLALRKESRRVAQRRQSDQVSKAHVDLAKTTLTDISSKPSAWWSIGGTVSGVVVGLGGDHSYDVLNTDGSKATDLVLPLVLLLIGFIGVAICFTRD